MEFDLIWFEEDGSFDLEFEEISIITDGGFEKGCQEGYEAGANDGYQIGYEDGTNDGYQEGYEEGLAHRTYEPWVITLTDGTIIEKEVGLV